MICSVFSGRGCVSCCQIWRGSLGYLGFHAYSPYLDKELFIVEVPYVVDVSNHSNEFGHTCTDPVASNSCLRGTMSEIQAVHETTRWRFIIISMERVLNSPILKTIISGI